MKYFNSFGPVVSLFSIAAFAYAVTHHRFLDIRLNLQRLLTYISAGIIILGTNTTIIFHLPTENTYTIIFANLTILLTATVLFTPLRRLLGSIYNLLIFGKIHNYREELRQVAKKIRLAKLSVSESSQQLLTALTQILGLSDCRLIPLAELTTLASQTDYDRLFRQRDLLYVDELIYEAETQHNHQSATLASALQARDISVLAPVKYGDNCLGALVTRGKTNGETFTSEELAEISNATEEAVKYLALIENAVARDRVELANLDHHINTPLTKIELELKELSSDPEVVAQHGALLARLSRELFSASQALRYFFEIERLRDYDSILREVSVFDQSLQYALTNLPGRLGQCGITHEPQIQIRGQTHLLIRGHKILVGNLLLELLANAVRFGQEPITVQVKKISPGRVSVQVINSGKLSPEQLKNALTKFGRIGQAAGSGLGLSYVQTFVEGMQGKFVLRSARGKVIAEMILDAGKN